MASFHFSPDLFLEVLELDRLIQFLDTKGFRKNILDNSINFGLIKNIEKDSSFSNGLVQQDINTSLGQQTIKVNPVNAIDSLGNFIQSDLVNGIIIPSDGNWYWVLINYQSTTQEKGTVAIDIAGNLTGIGTEFTKILRGQPNFATVVSFLNSENNILEYEVLEVIDDTHAILVYPGLNNDDADFVSESGLTFQIVGTFTEGVAVDTDNKYPFQYDSCQIQLVVEITSNQKPAYTVGQQFYLARVTVATGNLVVQDKRLDYWETKGSSLSIDIDKNANPLIGVESIRWQNSFNTNDRNIVQIGWGMRSTNWTVNSLTNVVTFAGSSQGGSYQSINDFTNGDFNGWRLYSTNGNYRIITNSIKQGSAINLYLDILDIDDYSNDGGITFRTTDQLFACPNCEEVELLFNADPTLEVENSNSVFAFPVNTPLADCLVTVFEDSTCLYNVQYRYKTLKEYTSWIPITSGSYIIESSYSENGILDPLNVTTYDYVSDPVAGFIQLELSPSSYEKFKEKIDKGDIIGVNTITEFTAGQVLILQVGVDKRYQHIVGAINVTDDIYISLSDINVIPGNEFRLHFDCVSMTMGNNRILIVDNYSSGTPRIIKTLTSADAFQMLNQEDGIVIDCVFDDTEKWIAYQNYDLGQPFETKMIDVTADQLSIYFDPNTKLGIIRGYFGWQLHPTLNQGRVPVGFGSITETYLNGSTVTKILNPGDTGGEMNHQTIINESPSHTHYEFNVDVAHGDVPLGGTPPTYPNKDLKPAWAGNFGGGSSFQYEIGGTDTEPSVGKSSSIGGDKQHNNMQPYSVTIFVKKTY